MDELPRLEESISDEKDTGDSESFGADLQGNIYCLFCFVGDVGGLLSIGGSSSSACGNASFIGSIQSLFSAWS